MEIRELESFLVVAEELHFGRAAERLHIAQPALSRTIQSLEKYLGAPLFERTTRRVNLTQAGQTLLEPAQNILDQVDGMLKITRSAVEGEIGSVRVGFAGAAGYSIVSALTRKVSQKAPGITIELNPRTYSNDAARLVPEGEIDLAIVSLPTLPDIETHIVQEEGFCLAVPERHPLVKRNSVRIEELEHMPFVSYPASHGSRVRDAMVAMCRASGFMPIIAQEAPDPYSMLALVGAEVGIAIVVESSKFTRLNGVEYIDLENEDMTLPLALAWRGSNPSGALNRVVAIAEKSMPVQR